MSYYWGRRRGPFVLLYRTDSRTGAMLSTSSHGVAVSGAVRGGAACLGWQFARPHFRDRTWVVGER